MLQVPPFPTATMSPLVSRGTSPSQSRSSSPHRTPLTTRPIPPPPPPPNILTQVHFYDEKENTRKIVCFPVFEVHMYFLFRNRYIYLFFNFNVYLSFLLIVYDIFT